MTAVLVVGAQYYLEDTESVYRLERAKLDGIARLYRTAENDRSLYSQYVSRFEALERQGVIGDEPRLNWVEALERVNQELKLPVLRYEIEPQQPLAFDTQQYNSQILKVFRSTMSFDAGLLHEGDLVVLIDKLRELTSGRFEVRDCDVKLLRPANAIVLDGRQANLSAVCKLDWYTLRILDTSGNGGTS